MATRLISPPIALVPGVLGLAAVLGVLAAVDPALALGATFGAAFVALALVNLTAGLIAFILIAFLEFVFPGGSVISLTKAAGAVLALSWLATVTTSARRTLLSEHPIALYLLLAFLSWGAISATWAADPAETWSELSRYLSVIALFVITYTAIRERRHLVWAIGAVLVGTAITAAYGLITRPSADPEVGFRLSSSVGDPNVLAAVLVAGLVLSLAALAALRDLPPVRIGAGAVALLSVLAFVLAGSRGGIISLAVALVVAVLVAGRWRAQVLISAVAVAAAAVLAFAAFAPAEIKDRIAETTAGESRSNEGRVTLWEVAWRMVEDRPLTGIGLGNFQVSSIDYVQEAGELGRTDLIIETPKVAHNIYLQALAETGVVGFVLLLALFAFALGSALAAARRFARYGDREMELLTRALFVALAGFLAAEFFVSESFNKVLWLLLGLGPALLGISRAGPDERAQTHYRRAGNRRRLGSETLARNRIRSSRR